MRWTRSPDDYAVIAPFFDAALGPFMMAIRREVSRKVLELGLRDFLDICCGTGHQARLLGEAGVRVVGIDRSASMIAVASRKNRGAVPFLLGDAQKLPFDDGSFDGALLSFALHENNPEQWHPMIREAARVIRPRGKLLIVDYLAPALKRSGMGRLFVHGVEWLAGERHYGSFRKFIDADGLGPILSRHSVTVLNVEPRFIGMVGLVVCLKNNK